VIAHRGFSGAWPENTAPAFQAAIAAGCHMIELDARRTAGERLAVVHDDDLTRYGYPDRRVSRLSLAELEHLDAGSWFARRFAGIGFLGLREALTFIGGRVPVNVEIKVDQGQEPDIHFLAGAVFDEVTRAGSPPVLLSTFSMGALRELRRAAPELPAALLLGRGGSPLEHLRELIELGAEGLHVHRGEVNPELIEAVRSGGLGIRIYTVNDPQEMQDLVSSGADGIFTDWPDRLLQVLLRGRR
jgi:glycerophosphoryl diester phosphodiesterase